jgi:hypothetical protein
MPTENTAGAVAAASNLLPWRRMRDKSLTAQNVGAGLRFSITIPRHDRTLLQLVLHLSGTTFPKSYISDLRLKLGAKLVTECTGTHLDTINAYADPVTPNAYYLVIDFTNKESKVPAAEQIGGIDISVFPPGQLYLEGLISASASAPAIDVEAVWGPPQGNNIIKVLRKQSGALSKTGKNTVTFEPGGADVLRMFMMYAGNDWCGTTGAATAWTGNTGDGAMGAITVSAGTKVGTYKLVIIEPGSNVGTFIVYDPDGVPISKKGAVASAFSAGGLAFTLADGATDFAAGDGFDIVVGATNNGNIYQFEIKKDGDTVFDRTCNEAREEQLRYGFKPQSRTYVVDFTLERNPEGMLRTAGAKSIEVYAYATATDTFDLYTECLIDANTLT